MNKKWYIYTTEYYPPIKKSEILPFAVTWMTLEGIVLTVVSQAEKNEYSVILLLCDI